jgi:hypothetical protein
MFDSATGAADNASYTSRAAGDNSFSVTVDGFVEFN